MEDDAHDAGRSGRFAATDDNPASATQVQNFYNADLAAIEAKMRGERAPEGHDLRGVSVHHLEIVFWQRLLSNGQDKNSKVYEVEPLIRKHSEQEICPRDGRPGSAYVDAIHEEIDAGISKYMLSYTWGYSVRDIIDTLVCHCTSKQLNYRLVNVWICCLCINQVIPQARVCPCRRAYRYSSMAIS